MKKLLLLAALACGLFAAAGDGNLLKADGWKFNDPARIVRQADGSFRFNAPDAVKFAEMRQTVVLDQKEVTPIRFGASFKTIAGNEYYRKESTYAAYMNLRLDDGSTIGCVMVGPSPANKSWENLTRTYVPRRPVKSAEFVVCLRKRTGTVDVRDVFMQVETPVTTKGMTSHGVGVATSELRHSAAGLDRNGRPFVIAAPLDAAPANYILYTELDTGKTFQYYIPVDNGFISGAVLTPQGKYVAGLSGKVVIFDVNTRKLTLAKDPAPGTCWSAALGSDGTVYLGNVPTTLFAVNPETGEVKNLGRMDPAETQLYWIACDKNGWIYCGNGMTCSGVVAFDPKTGVKRELVPAKYRKLGSGYAARLPDGNVYISTPSGFSAICLDGEILQTPAARTQELPVPHLKYGTRLNKIDATRRVVNYDMNNRVITWLDGKNEKKVPVVYKSGGVMLTSLATGPDGKVYISSAHPHHLAMLDPKTGRITDFGYNPVIGGGNFCNMTSHDGKMYMCEYAHGRMWVFDPAKPVNYRGRSFFGGKSLEKIIAETPLAGGNRFGIVGELLLCQGGDEGKPFVFTMRVPKDGTYYLNTRFYRFPTYGIVTVKVNGETRTLDVCGPEQMGPFTTFGPMKLKAGTLPVEMSVVKNPKGKYAWFSINGLELADAPRTGAVDNGNPRIIGQWAKEVRRPRTIQVHPNGREVMMAGYSYDGMYGGQFGIHDLVSGKDRTIGGDWLPGESCIASEFTPDGKFLVGGTSINTHGGNKHAANAACAFRLDWATGKVVKLFRCPGATQVRAVALWHGKLLAAADNERMYVLDPVTLESSAEFPIGYPVRRAFQRTGDDRMFLIQSTGVAELDGKTFKPRQLASALMPITGGGAIADGKIYFHCGRREVHSFTIPPKAGK